jgi:hypothetical protein
LDPLRVASSTAARKLLDRVPSASSCARLRSFDASPLRLRGTTLVLHRAKLALRTPGTDRVIHGSLRRRRRVAGRGWRLEAVSAHWLRDALG